MLARGTRIRLTDTVGTACANVLLWRADAPWERLNVADTVKVPWQAYIGAGHPLLSDQGRVLATVVAVTPGSADGEAPVHLALGEVADVAQMQDDPSLAAAQPAGGAGVGEDELVAGPGEPAAPHELLADGAGVDRECHPHVEAVTGVGAPW